MASDAADSPTKHHFVRQRTYEDCGCAAIATLLNITYEEAASAWRGALNRAPNKSNYRDLVAVLESLGKKTKRGRTLNGIRRVRPEPGAKISHWVVLASDWVYCPTRGIFHKDHYPWQAWGAGLEIR